MKPIKQTTFGDGGDGSEPGNCFATCVASILELPLSEVPNFITCDDWFEQVNMFLMKYGYSLVIVDINHEYNFIYHSGFLIAAGKAARGLRHCVVYHGSEPVHDPHPDGMFLEEVDRFYLFVSLNPNGEIEVRTCRKCGCTDNDCRQCIEKTGQACYWVEWDLCSACEEGEVE